MKKDHDIIEVECVVKHETDKAYLLETVNGEAWVPKSKCDWDGDTMQMPEWLAEEKGLI